MKTGWETKKLGEVCEFQRGLTYTKSDEVDISDNIVLRATNIDLTKNLLDFTELKYINNNVVVPSSKKVRKNSLIICTASGSKSHLGKVAYIDDDYDYAFGGFMGMITPTDGLLPKYLFHLMTSDVYKDFIGALSDGANINNLKFDDLKAFPVPLPPLSEQQRIVAKLDEAFAAIAKAKENAEKNVANARAIFESERNAAFRRKGERWKDALVGDVADRFEYGTAAKSNPEGKVPVLRMGNIQNGSIDWTDLVYSNDDEEIARYTLRKGDVLFNRTNSAALVGKTAIYDGEETAIFAGYLIRIHCKEDKIDPNYLCYFLNSEPARQHGENVMSRSINQANISGSKLKNYPLPLPELHEQRRIVKRLSEIQDKATQLERIYDEKIMKTHDLKNSLLHHAFNGHL